MFVDSVFKFLYFSSLNQSLWFYLWGRYSALSTILCRKMFGWHLCFRWRWNFIDEVPCFWKAKWKPTHLFQRKVNKNCYSLLQCKLEIHCNDWIYTHIHIFASFRALVLLINQYIAEFPSFVMRSLSSQLFFILQDIVYLCVFYLLTVISFGYLCCNPLTVIWYKVLNVLFLSATF